MRNVEKNVILSFNQLKTFKGKIALTETHFVLDIFFILNHRLGFPKNMYTMHIAHLKRLAELKLRNFEKLTFLQSYLNLRKKVILSVLTGTTWRLFKLFSFLK